MKCPNCNAEVGGAKFCPECGTKVSQERICSKCGSKLSNNAKFCPECGTPYGSVARLTEKEEAKIYDTWVDHNVYQDGEKGMLIHVKFDVCGLKNVSNECGAYFCYSNGKELRDHYGKVVCVVEEYCPQYEETIYNDFQLFMPYDDLQCSGNLDLKFLVGVWSGDEILDVSDYIEFTYSDEDDEDDDDDDGMSIAEGIGAFAGGFLAGLAGAAMSDDDDY